MALMFRRSASVIDPRAIQRLRQQIIPTLQPTQPQSTHHTSIQLLNKYIWRHSGKVSMNYILYIVALYIFFISI